MRYLILTISLLLVAVSCKTPEPVAVKKDEPVFRTYQGKARIVSIVPAKEDDGRDSGSYMEIYYDFTPSAADAHLKYRFPESADKRLMLNYDNRRSFHKNWIMKWGVKVGNDYPALRYEAEGKKTGPHVYYDVELTPSR